jgi:hypothetical protein
MTMTVEQSIPLTREEALQAQPKAEYFDSKQMPGECTQSTIFAITQKGFGTGMHMQCAHTMAHGIESSQIKPQVNQYWEKQR